MRIPASNLFLMIFSVILAVLLWLWVSAEERSEIIVSVPLQYRNLPSHLEIVPDKDLTTSVSVWVQGTTSALKDLRPQEISAWVDLTNATAGEKSFEIENDQVKVPYGFSVVRISPSPIRVRVEQYLTRLVPVIVQFEGEPRSGYEVSETTIVPSRVQIRGPQSAIDSIRHVVTDPIDISSITGNYLQVVNISAETAAVQIGSIRKVKVALKITEIKDTISFGNISVKASVEKRGLRFNPKHVRVDLIGPKRLLSSLAADQVIAKLELEGLPSGTHDLVPQIDLPEEWKSEVLVKDVIPERIHVTIP